MMNRSMSAGASVFLLLLLAGCPQSQPEAAPTEQTKIKQPTRPEGLIGFYVNDDPSLYGEKDMKDVPPGQVRHLFIDKDRWMLRDMMTAFGGTWSKSGTGATLKITEAPNGKADGKDSFVAKRTEKGIELTNPKDSSAVIRFTYLTKDAPADFGMDEFLGPAKE